MYKKMVRLWLEVNFNLLCSVNSNLADPNLHVLKKFEKTNKILETEKIKLVTKFDVSKF